MNVIGATNELKKYLTSDRLPASGPASGAHLSYMIDRMTHQEKEFSEGKRNRWLGYIQGVLVALEVATLDEMKHINERNIT